MNRLVYLLVLLGMLSGCSLFKRKVESEQQRSSTSTELSNIRENDIRKESRAFTILDSLREDVVVEIVPNGPFSYSFGNGFQGTAIAIKLKGKRTGSTQMHGITDLFNVHRQVQQSTSHKKETETISNGSVFRFDARFFFFVISVIGIGLLCVWLRYKRKHHQQ